VLLDFFNLLGDGCLTNLQLLVFVLEIDEPHPDPVNTSVRSLAKLLILGDFFKEV
jgi:hypothetical protein